MLSAPTYPRRNQPSYPNIHHTNNHLWSYPSPTPSSTYNNNNNNNNSSIYSFGTDQTNLFAFQPQNLTIQVQPELMQSEQSTTWLSNGQLTPTSATTRRNHHRESSLSSLGSAGPSSPYNANTSNPHVALATDPVDIYYDLHDQSQYSVNSKPLTPAHTPSQEQFLASQYSRFNPQSYQTDYSHSSTFDHLPTMVHDGLPRQQQQAVGDAELMPAPDFSHSGRPSTASVASHESPSTPPSYEDERRRNAEYRSTMPKLDRTMTDIYQDELYNPSFQITSAPPARSSQSTTTLSPAQNDIFTQRLQAANNQHINSLSQTPLNIPSRERSPFRQGSPLAPSANSFASNMRLGTAQGMREQQKAENDARVLQQQLERASPVASASTPKTISPKDVDLIYHENEEDAGMPLFPKQEPQSPQQYRPRAQQNARVQEQPELDDASSQHSYASMATSRRESSSYSASSQATPQTAAFTFTAPPNPAANMRSAPQQYPFVSQARRQPSNLSSGNEEFPSTLTSMESSSSEYAPEVEIKKPARTAADSGTYTCTYHNCTLRFDTPSKLQKHKREGHRQSAAAISGAADTEESLRNSQAGPHKCERINPSTGKPCNTIFSRPYDLTRHEDTIHNARKQKIRCNLCTEEKTFSRGDALTRHFRVVHPTEELPGSRSHRRRVGSSV
ncbi:Transcriptional regulator RPN4 [Phlyctema vagabunda]|uniref:Transcriptional regulator RPN4 n=1 Tax=Phlyctema vagabunda TaxID=108571 RepID=A0ABR4PF52_9HELO